jgi:hypothetical protein
MIQIHKPTYFRLLSPKDQQLIGSISTLWSFGMMEHLTGMKCLWSQEVMTELM